MCRRVCVCVFMQGACQQNGMMWSFTCCLCVFVNSCMFSLATQTWQALEQRTDRDGASLSTSEASKEQNGASFVSNHDDLHPSHLNSCDGGPQRVQRGSVLSTESRRTDRRHDQSVLGCEPFLCDFEFLNLFPQRRVYDSWESRRARAELWCRAEGRVGVNLSAGHDEQKQAEQWGEGRLMPRATAAIIWRSS